MRERPAVGYFSIPVYSAGPVETKYLLFLLEVRNIHALRWCLEDDYVVSAIPEKTIGAK